MGDHQSMWLAIRAAGQEASAGLLEQGQLGQLRGEPARQDPGQAPAAARIHCERRKWWPHISKSIR